MWDLSF
ncbi:UNVERIFIED_CONTAM: hypothetical protein GTU68_051995 [Idotea baltica]|nr:hypothetical protein [Idotea baltica]